MGTFWENVTASPILFSSIKLKVLGVGEVILKEITNNFINDVAVSNTAL